MEAKELEKKVVELNESELEDVSGGMNMPILADDKGKIEGEQLKDVNGGVAIHFVSAEEDNADDGAVWFGTPTENGEADKLSGTRWR